jgi:apolipoprotein N-acyltransferase
VTPGTGVRFRAGAGLAKWFAFLAGAASVLAYAPFELSLLAPLLLAALWLLWDEASPREAAWLGFWFGFGLFTAGTWWLYISLNILGGLWPPLAILMMLSLTGVMGIFIAAKGWLTVSLAPMAGPLRHLAVAPAIWTLIEWLRGWIFTGFPWLSVGYSQPESWFGALAPVGGVYAVTWGCAVFAGLLVTLLRGTLKARWVSLAIFVGLLGILAALERQDWTRPAGSALKVTLVQGAIPQDRKWKAEQLQPTLDLYSDMTLSQADRDLVIWPEAAVPALPFEVRDFLVTLHEELVSRNTQLYTGILTVDIDQGEYLNTLWAIGAEEGMYYKRHLVPFGEFFPVPDFVKRWLRLMNLPSEDIARGADDQPLLRAKDVPVAATICYEIAFGSEQLRFLPEAQLLVNVSNDAWFGDSFAPHQHLQMAQMRSLETGRYLLRATNTGITAITTPDGLVADRITQFEPGFLNAVVQPRVGATPYVRFGNWLIISLCGLLAVAGGWLGRRTMVGAAEPDE